VILMNKKNKIFFVLPEYESEWKVSLAGVAPPTGPTFLYSFARNIGFGNYNEGRCIDLSIHSEDKILAEIKLKDLVCVTTIISNYYNSIAFIKKAKERGAIIAVGGPWASVRAKQIQLKHPEIDYIVVGEGEAALKEIFSSKAPIGILRKQPILLDKLPSLDFSGWTKKDLSLFQNNYINLLNTGEYGPIPDVIPAFIFYQSSRGCIQRPRCKFCGCRLGHRLVFRTGNQFYQDIKNIVNQLSWLNNRIHVFDCSDSFTSVLHRFAGNIHSIPNVTFTTYARVDEITQASADILRRLGVTKVSLGIESGSSQALTEMGKGTKIEQNLFAVKTLKEVGISVYINLMYGLPGEGPGDIQRTVNHFIELSEIGDIYRVAGRVMTPLPNARWFFDLLRVRPDLKKEAEEEDLLDIFKFQKAWLEAMTHVSMEDIQNEHTRLVRHAKKKGISLSSEIARGIV